MDMASRALSAYQEASTVAGNNLANVNNPGYARQQVNIQSSLSIQTSLGQEGTGVDAVSITQIRDSILDNEITSETSVSSGLSARQSALQQAEAYMSETITNGTSSATSSTGLGAKITSFFNSLQSLSSNPSDATLRQQVISSAQVLTGQFNSISANLTAQQASLKTSIGSDIAAANQDMTDIASFNKQIIQAQSQGQSANELIDQRQQKIEDLASKINIGTVAQSNGSIDITLAGKQFVVGGSVADQLQLSTGTSGNVVLSDTNPGVGIGSSSGSIAGKITARDTDIQGTLSSLSTLASSIISQVNSVYSTGYDLNGGTGQNFFTGSSASDIAVNSTVTATTFQAAGVPGAKADNTVAVSLAKLAKQSISGLGNTTFSASYTSTVEQLGGTLSTVNDQLSNATAVKNMLNQQRSSVSGVNTDEELTNLTVFQKAYEASAKMVSTISAMLETVISMKV